MCDWLQFFDKFWCLNSMKPSMFCGSITLSQIVATAGSVASFGPVVRTHPSTFCDKRSIWHQTKWSIQNRNPSASFQVVGTRFHYQLQRGCGPNSGWISSKLKGRPLLVRADVRDTGKHLGNNAPIPELLYVQGSEKHGTLREVQGAEFGGCFNGSEGGDLRCNLIHLDRFFLRFERLSRPASEFLHDFRSMAWRHLRRPGTGGAKALGGQPIGRIEAVPRAAGGHVIFSLEAGESATGAPVPGETTGVLQQEASAEGSR